MLQLILLIGGIFIYMPFVKMMDKQYIKDEVESVSDSDNAISFDDL